MEQQSDDLRLKNFQVGSARCGQNMGYTFGSIHRLHLVLIEVTLYNFSALFARLIAGFVKFHCELSYALENPRRI